MSYTGILHGICASRFVCQYLSPFYVVEGPKPTLEIENVSNRKNVIIFPSPWP